MSIGLGKSRRGGRSSNMGIRDPLQDQQSHSVSKNHSQMDSAPKPERYKSQMDGRSGGVKTQTREVGLKGKRK